MRILTKQTLRKFWNVHKQSEQQLLIWYKEMNTHTFKSSHELLNHFPNCRIIGSNRYIFNIKGNEFRLIVKINFELHSVWIRFIGTHNQYYKIDPFKI